MDDESSDPYGLRKIVLADKQRFESYLGGTPERLSDYTFACCAMWAGPIGLRWTVLRDHLCVFANGSCGLTMIMPPVGAGNLSAAAAEAVDLCRQFNRDHGYQGDAAIEYVSSAIRRRFHDDFTAEPMSGDYVYATPRLISLEGKHLASKRHDCNRYRKRYPARCEPFGPQHVAPCLQILRRWQDQHAGRTGGAYGAELKRNKESHATAEAILNYHALGLTGMVLYAGDQLIGFTFGELLAPDTCSILIEKTDRFFAGSAQYIFNEFCKQYWAHTAWCNVGDDWDVPSLAWTKQSYRPAYRLDKWRLIPPPPGKYVPVAPVTSTALATALSSAPQSPEPAQLSDLDDLERLEQDCFEPALAIRRRQFRRLIQHPGASVLVIRRDGRVVADAVLLRRRTADGLRARLYSLAVHPASRNQGMARALLDACLQRLRQDAIERVLLEVRADNAAAIALYRQAGFVELRRLPDYYGHGKGGLKMVLHLPLAPRATPGVPNPAAQATVPV